MMTKPSLPLLLQPGLAQLLNRRLVDKTGCFAFLKTDLIIPFKRPASYHDAFLVYVVGLYALYHDYGCQFLPLLLSDKMSHPLMVRRSLHVIRRHIEDVNSYLRPNVAHGVYEIEERTKMQTRISNYYLQAADTGLSSQKWPEFLINLTDDHWEIITRRIINDSNKLYHFLEQWADAWGAETITARQGLKNDFARDEGFRRSFNARICTHIIKQCGLGVDSQKFYKGWLSNWQQELCQEFLSEKACTPDALYQSLWRLIEKAVNPPADSSTDIAKKHGFGF
jgi:hypothetical protein